MPQFRYRTHGLRKRSVKTPGGKIATHYKKKKTAPAKCAMCGRPLSGIPRVRPSRLKSLARSSKKPNRPYGGNLCPSCSRTVLKAQARAG